MVPTKVQAADKEQHNAQTTLQCPIPTFTKIAVNEPAVTDDSIKIISKYSTIERDQIANFSGGVTLIDKAQKIISDKLAFDRLSMQINAQGNINYQNQAINIFASELNANHSSQSTTMTDASYQLYGSPGHGSAEKLQISTKGGLSLLNSTFTSCLGDTPDWQIKASKIKISADGDIGKAYHAQIKVFDIPILYIPYFSFPVSNKRMTGFLYPEIGSSSSSGLEIEAPFYWNITENMDATITPHYMSKRGTQLKTEFRYLAGLQSGTVDIEYLNKDNALQNNDDPRYLMRLQHIGTFSENFRAYIDYTTISDDNYLVDIGSSQYNSNDAYLYQIGELSYFGHNWQTTIKLQDFEVLGKHEASYKTLPHIEISARQPLPFLSGQFELYSEMSQFEADDATQVKANRYHAEAGLNFPISTPAWFLNSEFRLMHTYYDQENIQIDSNLEETVSRTLPKIRFHGGINFDRQMTLFDQSYRHTFEPQLQYLYIPEKDQSNIGLYDTINLQDDYNGLFRDRRFSGLDRIASANQYTWGITSRILDSSNLEIFRLSVGRIHYLSNSYDSIDFDNNTNLIGDAFNSTTFNNQEASVAGDLFYRLNHQWQISGDIQYNTIDDFTNKSQVNLDYQVDKYNSIQLNHRYTRSVSGTSLEQISVLASLAINKNWAFVGRVSQDLQLNRSLETYAGFQYESCCWAVRIAYHRHINSNLSGNESPDENRDEFDSGFMVQFKIKGLDGKQSPIGTQKMFNSSIFGYKRPYYLQN
ncbi:MAG: LPS assembly protein LptD [Colwellia sp.]